MRNICCVLASCYFRPQGVVSRVEVKIVFESTIYHLWAIALLSSPLNMFVNSYLQHLSWSILIINKCFPKSILHNAFQARRHFESRNSPNLLKNFSNEPTTGVARWKGRKSDKIGLRTHVLWRKTLINSLQVWNRCEFWHNSK